MANSEESFSNEEKYYRKNKMAALRELLLFGIVIPLILTGVVINLFLPMGLFGIILSLFAFILLPILCTIYLNRAKLIAENKYRNGNWT